MDLFKANPVAYVGDMRYRCDVTLGEVPEAFPQFVPDDRLLRDTLVKTRRCGTYHRDRGSARLSALLRHAERMVQPQDRAKAMRLLPTPRPAMLLAGRVPSLVAHWNERTTHAAFSWAAIWTVAYLAVFGSGVAFYRNLCLLQRIHVSTVGFMSLSTPMIAVCIGVSFGRYRRVDGARTKPAARSTACARSLGRP